MKNINTSNWAHYSVSFKIVIIAILALLLLIPISMVKGLIYEREFTKSKVVSEIGQKWGERQTVVGPVLSIPYKKYILNSKGESKFTTQYIHVLPENLSINANVKSELRSRGIFDAVVYKSNIEFFGNFSKINLDDIDVKSDDIVWKDAFVSIGISDVRGIKNNIKLDWDKQNLLFKPGVKTGDVILKALSNGNYDINPYAGNTISYQRNKIPTMLANNNQGSGVSVQVPYQKNKEYEFSINLNLNGSRDLQFVPLGKETNINLNSDWGKPSFRGSFLPYNRDVSKDGFSASWKVFDLNRGYPQIWTGDNYNVYPSALGVNFLVTVDDYKKAERSVKYAILIIALTFLVFFFVEVFSKRKIHPIQYILVGLAIVLFYALLVSISEVINFSTAYIISAFATIFMISLYSKNVFKSKKMAFIQGSILLFLYIFVFIILQLEDYALLIGSLLLFFVLAFVMYISRKIDWYKISENTENK